jgi:L-lactate dehydrogenase complex protein LldF
MPHLRPEDEFKQLPFASSLCGACSEACPVVIPLHERLLQWRDRIVRRGDRPNAEALAFGAWAWLMRHPAVYRGARPPAEWTDAVAGFFGPGRRWKATRDLPPLAERTFADWWKKNRDTMRDRDTGED